MERKARPKTTIETREGKREIFLGDVIVQTMDYDAGEGLLRGYASVAGFQDAYKEIIDYGAFKGTLKRHEGRILCCWQHNWREPIGKPHVLKEVPKSRLPKSLLDKYPEATGALYFEVMIIPTRRGEDVKKLLQASVITENSIGFDVLQEYQDDDDVWHLAEIELYELSPVSMAAMPAATVIEYKGEIPEAPDMERPPPAPFREGPVYCLMGDGRLWKTEASRLEGNDPDFKWELANIEEWAAETCRLWGGDPDIKRELVKVEETEDTIRVPNPGVGDCDVTATITISADEGIKALYCGKVKKVRTFLFAKAKGWTVAKAVQWVKDHADEHKAADYEDVPEWIRDAEVAIMMLVAQGDWHKAAIALDDLMIEAELPQPAQGQAEALALWIRVQEASLELGASNAPGG